MVQVKIVKQIKKDRMKSIVNLTNKKYKDNYQTKKGISPSVWIFVYWDSVKN